MVLFWDRVKSRAGLGRGKNVLGHLGQLQLAVAVGVEHLQLSLAMARNKQTHLISISPDQSIRSYLN